MEINKGTLGISNDEITPLKTGTTTVGIMYKDGVIVATESQATANYFVATKNAQKLFKVNDYVAATISGGVADCQYVVNHTRALSNLRHIETDLIPEPKYIANLVRNLLFQGRSYFLAIMIVGGYSEEEKKGKLYGIDLVGTMFEDQRFLSFGSGSPYALGVMEADWRPKLTEEGAITLARDALTSARQRDAGSGYALQIVRINKKGFKPIEGFHG